MFTIGILGKKISKSIGFRKVLMVLLSVDLCIYGLVPKLISKKSNIFLKQFYEKISIKMFISVIQYDFCSKFLMISLIFSPNLCHR